MVKKVIASVILLTTTFGFSQDQLSLQDAVFMALANNYNIQIAHRQVEISELNNSWGEAGAWPTVSLSASFNNNIQDNTKNPFTFTPGLILSQSLSPSLNVNWNLFSGFAVQISKERLELIETQSKGNALAIIETTAKEVILAYYSAQVQEERLKLFANLKSFSRDKAAYYQRKADYGTSNSLESMQFMNQYFTDSTNYELQEVNYQNALRNLLLVMNDTNRLTKDLFPVLTDRLVTNFEELDYETAHQAMVSSNQNLKNQYISVELQKKQTELQRSFLYPTLTFQAGVSPSKSWLRNLQDESLQIAIPTVNYFGSLSLRYNLFNNYKTKRTVEVSKIQEDIAELNLSAMEATLASNLRNGIALYEVRKHLLSISMQNLEYAEKTWELAKRKYELGSLNSIELATIQNSYQNTLLQHYENLFNAQEAYLNVYQLMGQLGLQYVKEK